MSKTKYSFARYRIIDRELRKKDWVKTKELARIIKNEFGISISERQIQKDMDAMETDPFLDYNAPIDYDAKNKAYRYKDKKFTIQAFKLQEEEVSALKFFASSLNQYKDYNLFKDFSNAIEKVVEAVKIKTTLKSEGDSKIIIQTDNNSFAIGNEYLVIIIQALEEKRVIEFGYQKFGELKSSIRIVEPILLKEYRNRWYLISNSIQGTKKELKTYALDRMVSMRMTDNKYKQDKSFSPNLYYKHSFGITREDKKVETIVLQFPIEQSYFVKSLPIHTTQRIIKETKDYIRISLEIIPSYEFYECVLGYADCVKVISPKKLASTIKDRLKAAILQYN